MFLRLVPAFMIAILALLHNAPLSPARSEERSVVRIDSLSSDDVIVPGRRQWLPGLREIQDYNAAEIAALQRRYVTPVRKPRAFESDIRVAALPEHALLARLIAESRPLREHFTAGTPR